MAATGYDLGNVVFGLSADTSSLQRSLDTLKQFGEKTNQVARSAEEGSKRIEAAYARQESAIMGAYTRIQNLNTSIKSVGAPIDLLRQTSGHMRDFTATMTKGALSSTEFARAASLVREKVADVQRQLQKGVAANRNQDAIASALYGGKASYERTTAQITRVGANIDTTALQQAHQEFAKAVQASGGRMHEIHAAQRAYNQTLGTTVGQLKDWQSQMRQIDILQRQVSSITSRQVRYGLRTGFPAESAALIERARSRVSAQDFAGASNVLNTLRARAAEAETQIAKAASRTEQWSTIMRGFERATILSMGPLSGLGARAAVMASLFESMTVKSALFLAGTTALGAGLVIVATSAVKATMELQRWEAMLTAASGAEALVSGEMKYLYEQADKYGQSIRAVVPAYASFATSARLSNISLKEQRDIFEAVITASTALKWNNEQLGRAFLATEQMFSKGTVQMQELKLQMGQVLPGAFELAAIAMGKTQRELGKMMEQGQLLTKDFAPKFFALVKETYDVAAQLGMRSIQSEIGRFETQLFKVAESFDRVTSSSVLFQKSLEGINAVLKFLSDNMRVFISIAIGAFVALAASYIPAIIKGFALLLLKIGDVTKAIVALNFVTSLNPMSWLLRAGAAIVGVVAGYKMLEGSIDSVNVGIQEQINKSALSVASLVKQGEVSKRVYDEMKQHIVDNIVALQLQIEQTKKAANTAYTEQQKKRKQSPIKQGLREFFGMDDTDNIIGDAFNDIVDANNAIITFRKQLEALLGVKVKVDKADKFEEKGDKKRATSFQSASQAIEKLINDYKDLQTQEKLIMLGDVNADKYTEASNKAKDFLTGISEHSGLAAELFKKYGTQLRALGISGTNLEGVLTGLNMQTSLQKERVGELLASLKAWEEHLKGIASMEGKVQKFTQSLTDKMYEAFAQKNPLEALNFDILKEKAGMLEQALEIALDNPSVQVEDMLKLWDQMNNRVETFSNYMRDLKAPDAMGAELEKLYSSISDYAAILESEVTIGSRSAASAQTALKGKTLELATAYKDRLGNSLNDLLYQLRDMPEAYNKVLAMQMKLNATIDEAAKSNWWDGMAKGAQEYADAMGDSFSRMKDATTSAFKTMENALVEFAVNGKLSVSDMLRSIYADLVRFSVQQNITGNLAQAMSMTNWGNIFGGGGSGGGTTAPIAATPSLIYAASGGIITNKGKVPLKGYSSGGIADRPQLAMFGEGSTPEAYVPVPSGRIPVELRVKDSGSAPIINIYVTGIRDEGGLRKSAGQVAQAAAGAISQSRRYN